jgi:predicted permease
MDSSFYETVISTFMASVKSVGTACTLAVIGIYLHQRGFVAGNGKRTLALISQQVTIPLLFFTKILYCNQDWSSDACPNVTDSLGDAWILLVWPIWVCCAGMLIGYIVTLMADVPKQQRNSIIASVAFGNSTGLPITLLTVIHSNFGASSALGSIDPTLFLSVYLVMYPVLQWGIGGFLLAPPPTEEDNKKLLPDAKDLSIDETADESSSDDEDIDQQQMEAGAGLKRQLSLKSSIRKSLTTGIEKGKTSLARNVVNLKQNMSEKYQIDHRGLDSIDASMYLSVQENLDRWGKPVYGRNGSGSIHSSSDSSDDNNIDNNNTNTKWKKPMRTESDASIGMDLSGGHHDSIINENEDEGEPPRPHEITTFTTTTETSSLLPPLPVVSGGKFITDQKPLSHNMTSSTSTTSILSTIIGTHEEKVEKLFDTIRMVLKRCFQPPVIAALMGLLFASFPRLRGILVDIIDRQGRAPLQWFFDGLFNAGQAAVPINMIILGCNLSASYMLQPSSSQAKENSTIKNHSVHSKFFSNKASLYVVIGKMIVMPILGVLSTLVLRQVYTVPEEIAGGLYLVLLIVFLCPTANNVMVMVELSGSGGGSKEGMARIIAYQYAIAPIVLSGTVTCAVLIASHI